MLQSQEPEENTPLAERRVTTEEFTQAVAALEARKEEERRHLAGTVPIAQTVQELGIDAKPDEIWAEVEAQRARQAAASATPQQIPVSTYNSSQSVNQQTPRRQRRVRWFPLVLVIFFAARFFTHHIDFTTGNGSSTAPVSTSNETLLEVPNGHAVFCDNVTLDELEQGRPLSQVLVHEKMRRNEWTLIKYDGQVYLRGYTTPYSVKAVQSQPMTIYNEDSATDPKYINWGVSSPITIQLDNRQWERDVLTPDFLSVTVQNPVLDSHARETWSP